MSDLHSNETCCPPLDQASNLIKTTSVETPCSPLEDLGLPRSMEREIEQTYIKFVGSPPPLAAVNQAAELAARVAEPVQYLYRQLAANANQDSEILEQLRFGLSVRPARNPKIASSLLVPVSILIETIPSFFDCRSDWAQFVGPGAEGLHSMTQCVTLSEGVMKIYLDRKGLPTAIGNLCEFKGDVLETAEACMGQDPRTWLVSRFAEMEPDSMRKELLDAISPALFAAQGGGLKPGIQFRGAESVVRITSCELPRAWAPKMPMYLKTTHDGACLRSLKFLAEAQNRQDLEERVRDLGAELTNDQGEGAHGAKGAGLQWQTMDWEKPPDRGVVFILQGIEHSTEHHIWSCADKGPKIDGRFFKEYTQDAISYPLQELTGDLASVRALCYAVALLK